MPGLYRERRATRSNPQEFTSPQARTRPKQTQTTKMIEHAIRPNNSPIPGLYEYLNSLLGGVAVGRLTLGATSWEFQDRYLSQYAMSPLSEPNVITIARPRIDKPPIAITFSVEDLPHILP